SLSTLSSSLGLPFSIEHIRRQRSKILMYFIISNILYAGFTTTILIASPILFGIAIVFIGAGQAQVGTIGAIIVVGSVVIAVVCLAGGALMRNVARRAARISILQLQKFDARPPLLFLRAFRDDQVYLAPPRHSLLGYCYDLGRRESNLDVLVLEEGTDSG